MKVACQNCGAPLEVHRGHAFAQCAYCGHANKVKSAQTLMAERPRPVPTPPVAPVAAPRPTPPRPAAPNTSMSPVAWLGLLASMGSLLFGAYKILGAMGVLALLPSSLVPHIDFEADPSLGTLDLSQPPGAPLQGVAEGQHDARELGSLCRGFLPTAPHVRLRLATGGVVQLDVGDSNVDLVMAVHQADGSWQCDDDGGSGTLPRLRISLPAGDHEVFVGTYAEGGEAGFTLRTTWMAVDAPTESSGLAPDATPSLATVTLGPDAPPSGIWPGTTSAWVSAEALGPRCRGSIPAAPHLRLQAMGGERVRLVTRDASTDLTMILRTPSGRFVCDDDSGSGLNPRIDTILEAGNSAVWVGVFGQRDSGEFTMELSPQGGRRTGGDHGLRPDAMPVLGTANLDITATPDPVEGQVRTDLDARALDPSCRGWVGDAPDFSVITTIGRPVRIQAVGRADLTLLVRGPDGRIHCDDDSAGDRLPRIDQALMPGVTEVWVGRIRRRGSPDFVLTVAPAPS